MALIINNEIIELTIEEKAAIKAAMTSVITLIKNDITNS
jgi:hypothetical protein